MSFFAHRKRAKVRFSEDLIKSGHFLITGDTSCSSHLDLSYTLLRAFCVIAWDHSEHIGEYWRCKVLQGLVH